MAFPMPEAGQAECLGAVGQFAGSKWLVLAEILGVVEGDNVLCVLPTVFSPHSLLKRIQAYFCI